jgi:hypothetical protein
VTFIMSPATPAQAGVQEGREKAWIPALDRVDGRPCAEMTILPAQFDWTFKRQCRVY